MQPHGHDHELKDVDDDDHHHDEDAEGNLDV